MIKYNEYMDKMLIPAKELGEVTVSNIEKITDIQLKAVKSYADTGIKSMKQAIEIKDMEDLKTFWTVQAAATKSLAESSMADTRKVTQLGQSYVDEAKAIVSKAFAIN